MFQRSIKSKKIPPDYQPASNLIVNCKATLKPSNVYQIISASANQSKTLRFFLNEWKLSGYEMINVNFCAYMSRDCYQEDSDVKLNFFIKEKKSTEYQPLLVKYDPIDIQQSLDADNQLYYRIETRAILPSISNKSSFEIAYFYTIEYLTKTTGNIDQVETLQEYDFLKNLEIRIYDPEYQYENQTRIEGAIIFNEKIDSIIIKTAALKCFMRLDSLFSDSIVDASVQIKCLDRIRNVYKCLCVQSQNLEYKKTFITIIMNHINRFVQQISGENTQTQPWHNYMVISIIYASFEFDLQVNINELLVLHKPINNEYFSNLYSHYSSEQKSCLMTALSKFLKNLVCQPSLLGGLNAYLLHYYLSKKQDFANFGYRKSSTYMLDFLTNNIQSYEMSDVTNVLNKYRHLFPRDHMLGALFLSYFPINRLLIDHFMNSDSFLIESLISYMNIMIKNNRLYSNEDDLFSYVLKNLTSSYLSVLDATQQFNLIISVNNLLKLTIQSDQKKKNLIICLIHFCLGLIIKLQDFIIELHKEQKNLATLHNQESESKNKIFIELNNFFKEEFLKTVKQWLNKECHESLLINFGIEKRADKDILMFEEEEECLRNIRNLKKYTMYDNNTRLDTDMKSRLSKIMSFMVQYKMPEYMNISDEGIDLDMYEYEIKTRQHIIGTSDEAQLYNLLLELPNQGAKKIKSKLNRSMSQIESISFIDLFKEKVYLVFDGRLTERSEIDFSELVKFSSTFEFNRFNESYRDKFRKLVEMRIINRLLNRNKSSDIEILYESLKYNTNMLKGYTTALLEKKWPKNDANAPLLAGVELIEFIFKWEPFLYLIELAINSGHDTVLQPTWLRNYEGAFRYLAQTIGSIIRGEQKLDLIKKFCEHEVKVDKLSKFLIEKISNIERNHTVFKCGNFDLLIPFLRIRNKEAKEFEAYKLNMKAFIQYCSKFKQISVSVYSNQLEQLESLGKDIDNLQLKKICNLLNFEGFNRGSFSLSSFRPNIIYFTGITNQIMPTITKIINLDRSKSVLFDHFFNITCNELMEKSNKPIEIVESIENMWGLTILKLKTIIDPIESGSIKLTELDNILKKFFKNNFANMQAEINYLLDFFKISNLSERKNQILLWDRFKASHEAAKAIETIQIKLKIEQKFTQLDDLLALGTDVYGTWTLLKMDKRLAEIIKVLDSMSGPGKLECLKAYSESIELVEWLRVNAKTMGEIQVLTELISSSENNTGFNRTIFAKLLFEACSAYAALIYEFNVEDGFFRFTDLANDVCSYLETDKHIAEKLLAVKDKVALLDEIKRSKDNVEKSSLEQAKRINSFGIYKIDSISNKTSSMKPAAFETSVQYKIENLMTLELEEDSGVKIYTHEQLKDLQSILMLFAPRKQQSDTLNKNQSKNILECFIETFSGVTHFVELFIELSKCGCSFFDNFKIEFYCDFINREALNKTNCIIYLNQSAKVEISSGDPIRSLCKFMEDSFNAWSNFIATLRDRFNSLNHFTINQIQLINRYMNSIFYERQKDISDSDLNFIEAILQNIGEAISIENMRAVFEKTLHEEKKPIDLTDNSLVKSGINKLDEAWSNFMQIENSVKSNSLTLKHLSIILDILHEDNSSKKQVSRNIPGYLNKKISLITCSQQNQFSIVMSMYAYDNHAPMPSNDELIYCNTSTSYEEIEIFLRRAINSSSSKIHTILNSQELNYETSNKLENNYKKLIAKVNRDDFYIVFVCCNENESDSIIASLFMNYRISPVCFENSELITYLSSHLKSKSNIWPSYIRYEVQTLVSRRAGNGKSTYIDKLVKRLKERNLNFNYQIIRIKDTRLNINQEIAKLLKKLVDKNDKPTVYHIDIAFEVHKSVDEYMFNLIISRSLMHNSGLIWRRRKNDVYLFEMSQKSKQNNSIIKYIPRIEFCSPREYLYELRNNDDDDMIGDLNDQNAENLFQDYFRDPKFQRSCYYLKIINQIQLNRNATERIDDIHSSDEDLLEKDYDPLRHTFNEIECLESILEYSKLEDPSWHELSNFVNFLNEQLEICEKATLLKKFKSMKSICVQLLVMMANDFGLPSLNIQAENDASDNEVNLEAMKINELRRWENMLHPYIIFNADGETINFLGTYLSRAKRKFVNPNTGLIIENIDPSVPVLSQEVYMTLLTERVRIFDNFNDLIKEMKLMTLCKVMDLEYNGSITRDPLTRNYELTLDNCLKMMAIYLRFKVNNPVMIMGETGCGKTSLIKFFGFLHNRSPHNNLIHVKIHGGTSALDLENKLIEAEELSRINYNLYQEKNSLKIDSEKKNSLITAILFFDEANTTESIGLIKEIMCDLTCNGRPVDTNHGLKIVAAVNPYKKHSEEMIRKLEQAGLGFFVTADETKEKLGHIPMRQLVYRVQPLPSSLLPIVWDFGQLERNVENTYINQMLITAQIANLPRFLDGEQELLCSLINESQNFMRLKNDECSFVSIRDVERVIKVTSWFLRKRDLIFPRMIEKQLDGFRDTYQDNLSDLKRAFVLALSVCYHSCLHNIENRRQYRDTIAQAFSKRFPTTDWDDDWILCEILKCQNVFMDEINLKINIARNAALLENVFMMIICIELRIPLFIVGKPGSSKSLAKSIVASAMEGHNSKSNFFRNLKKTYFVNFQCSPLTTSDMIVKAFKRAAKFQESNDLESSVAVVNLDEIGLAEGSESMPLKSLHSLLEEGVNAVESENHEYGKVSVIGISNWALDPAKMNRGLFVSRGEPDIDELVISAKGICNYDKNIFDCIKPHVREIASAYLELCETARSYKREFFGLRDYYSLIKMLYWFCSKDKHLTWSKLEHAVKRNFNGLAIDIMAPFKTHLQVKLDSRHLDSDPKCNPIDLIESALRNETAFAESTSRYLLFLTENSSAIDIIQNFLIGNVKIPINNLSIIFGSSFRNDQQYSEICRNISLIKHNMEIGNTVILLNSYNLYESLYDALNQYYYELAGQKFVDLGLGTHSVKAAVHENFRLIVIAEKEAVYDTKRFPIPLINRLEKHFLTAANMLDAHQLQARDELDTWVKKYVRASLEFGHAKPYETFIGFHEDTTSSIILYLSKHETNNTLVNPKRSDEDVEKMENNDSKTHYETVIDLAKKFLIKCATPDSIIRAHSSRILNQEEKKFIWDEYFMNQKHLSLSKLLMSHAENKNKMNLNGSSTQNLIQITTNSKLTLLNTETRLKLKKSLDSNIGRESNLEFCILKSFDTMLQFSKRIEQFLTKNESDTPNYLFIQSDLNYEDGSDIISCARHTITEKFKEIFLINNKLSETLHIILLINLPKENVSKFVGFQLSHWSCYHLDEIEEMPCDLPIFENLTNKCLSMLLKDSLSELNTDKMETDKMTRSSNLNMSVLLKKLAHNACSLITDTNLARTISRIDVFINLCDDSKFVEVFGKRLVKLQEAKEIDYSTNQGLDWLKKEAANIKAINQYSTLRRSCQFYFESKLSPLIAYLLSNIDQYSNLESLSTSLITNKVFEDWKHDLWISILDNTEICRLDYSGMRSLNTEMNRFKCQSDLLIKRSISDYNDETRLLKPHLPFFWLIIDQLNNLHNNFLENTQNRNEPHDYNTYLASTVQLFQESAIFILFNQKISRHVPRVTDNSEFYGFIIDSYINDFVLKNCMISSEKDLQIVKSIVQLKIEPVLNDRKKDLKLILPRIHYLYHEIKHQIDFHLKFSAFNQLLNNSEFLESKESLFQNENLQLIMNSCIQTISLFKEELKSVFLNRTSDTDVTIRLRLRELIKLISEVLEDPTSQREILYGQYECMNLYLIFMDNFMVLSKQNVSLATYLNQMMNQLSSNYFKKDVNFKNSESVQNLHEFLVYAQLEVRKRPELSEYVERVEECFNLYYVNVNEFIIFERDLDENTIKLILNAITESQLESQTGKFKIKPIYRSLLIRIAYRSYSQMVIEYLKTWYEISAKSNNNYLFQAGENLALLFLDCVYDEYIQKVSEYELDHQILEADRICDEIKQIPSSNRLFKEMKMYLKTYNVSFLLVLAKLKFCIFIMAKVSHTRELQEQMQQLSVFNSFNLKLKYLFENHFYFFDTNEILINYLIKELIRSYGSSSVNYVMSNSNLNWLTPKHLIGDDESITDKYVINSRYSTFKEAIIKSFKEKKSTLIDETIAACNYDFHPYLLMALYQNVTLLYRNIGNVTSQILEIFKPIENKYFENAQHMTKALFENSFTHNLKVCKENRVHVDLSLLIMEMKFTVLYSNCTIVSALKDLILNPGEIYSKYLPTMPQDTLFDVKKALMDGTSTKFYVCPNGHQYAIGDCGRPWIKAICRECGSEIGGVNHSLEKKNKIMGDDLVDQTQTGYLLREAESLSDLPQTIRMLSNIGSQIVRFFLHACLYIACDDEDQKLETVNQAIINTNPPYVKEFLWKHMLKDLKISCKILNITVDELLILLHTVCFNFVKSGNKNNQEREADFQSKGSRQNWEHSFYKMYLAPTFAAVSENIASANKAIKESLEKDDSNQSKIYFMAYELTAQKKSEALYEMEKFWRFRPLVSFNFMSQELVNVTKSENFKILKRFAHLINPLELVFQLPEIMKLTNLFKKLLNKKIDKYKAQNMSLRQLLSDYKLSEDWTTEKVQHGVKCFDYVWSKIKQEIHNYIISNISSNSILTTNNDDKFDLDSKLSYFLPTVVGDGLYSYALIHYLASIHNDMITYYTEIKKEKVLDRRSIEEFENKEFIIQFNKQTDLLGLVQSNFSYDSRNLKCMFQYKDIENQLIDRFIRSKPLIEINKMSQFEYSDEIQNYNIFERIEAGNKQIYLELPLQMNLFGDFDKINDISEELNTLKIIINYASTTSINLDTKIISFIQKIYPNSTTANSERLIKSKTIETCELKHLKHIWMLLNVRRAVLYTVNNQDPFETLKCSFKNNEPIKLKLNMDSSMVISVLSVIYQIITVHLFSSSEDLDGFEDKKISDYFQYMSSLNVIVSDNITQLPASFPDDEIDLNSGADPLKMSQIYSLWKYLCNLKI